MFVCVPFAFLFRSSGTSRWLRYGLFSSLSDNDPGGDAAEGSDILQTANRNLTHRECLMVCVWEPNPHKEMNGPDPHLVDT